MLKLIYLARRKPGFTPDQFTRRWRLHGARGMATSFWRRAFAYVQAEPVRPIPMTGVSADHDAIATMIVAEDTFTDGFIPEDIEAAGIMTADELETFAGPIPEVSLWVHEEALKPGPLGGGTAFLFFRDAAAARAVAGAYLPEATLHRVTLNTRRSDAALGPMRNTLPYEAVVELAAAGVPALTAVLDRGPDSAFRRADLAVVTREAVLWDRLPPI